jgi:hypothetical protein
MKNKKIIYAVLTIVVIIFVVVFATALPAVAHGRVGIWIGPGWGPWWWGPAAYPYPYYDYYVQRPVVIQQQEPVYYQSTQPAQQYYWYFCPDSNTYYPYVKQCPSGWLKVIPPSTPPK